MWVLYHLQQDIQETGSVELTLEKLLSSAAAYNEDQWDATEQDPDVLDDPVMQLDIQVS